MSRTNEICGPWFMARTLRAAFRVILRFGRNRQRDLRKRISINVRIARRIATLFIQSPFRNALLSEIRVLQMAHPLKERDVPLHNGVEPLAGIRPVTGNAREELRHQRGMVERLLLVRAQVGLGTRHPEHVAMQQHLLMTQRLAVAPNQPLQSEWEKTIDA